MFRRVGTKTLRVVINMDVERKISRGFRGRHKRDSGIQLRIISISLPY